MKKPEVLWLSDADDDNDNHPRANHVAAALTTAKTVCALLIACHTGNSFADQLSQEIPYLVVASGELDLEYAKNFLTIFYAQLDQGKTLQHCLTTAKSAIRAWPSYKLESDSIRVYIQGKLLE